MANIGNVEKLKLKSFLVKYMKIWLSSQLGFLKRPTSINLLLMVCRKTMEQTETVLERTICQFLHAILS